MLVGSGNTSASQLEFVKLLSEKGTEQQEQKNVIRAELFLLVGFLKQLPTNTHVLGNIKENACLLGTFFLDEGLHVLLFLFPNLYK